MTIQDTSTPVVILKCVAHGPVGIVRTLGRLGIPVYAIHSNRQTPAFSSRYCAGKFVCRIEEFSTDSLHDVLAVGREIGKRSILIPTTDDGIAFVAENAERLREWFLFPDQSPQLVHSLANKRQMYHLAKKFRVPTAEAAFPQCRADIVEFAATACFPIMLKGIDGKRLFQRSGKRMFIVHNEGELLEKYDALEDPINPNLMLQEYIPGGDDTVWMFNGYFDQNSECRIGFTGKKIRQCPVHRGVTSLGICLKNQTVDQVTREFMKAIGYHGILDIGYRYDARDGKYKVLDINPRIGGTFRLFVAENGMDVARALYLDLTCQPIALGEAPDGRKWLVEDLDFVSSIRYACEGTLRPWQWLSSFRGVRELAYLAIDDLGPIIPMLKANLAEMWTRMVRKLRSMISSQPTAENRSCSTPSVVA